MNTNGHSKTNTLAPELLQKMNAYWRAANYLSVGQIYLCDNPLLERPMKLEHVKKMLPGHWGSAPGQNFIYTHLNRIVKEYDLNMIYISGPGHGAAAVVSNVYLEGTYSEFYPNISRDEDGLKQQMQDKLIEHKHYIDKHGQDLPEIRNWKWSPAEMKNGKPLLAKMRLPQLKRMKGIQNAHSTQ